MKPALQVVWFRRDLRVEDHEPLALAAKRGPVLPLYIAESSLIASPEFDARHWTFIRASLIEIRRRLFALGQPLIVRVGEAAEVMDQLHDEAPFSRIWMHDEIGAGRSATRDAQLQEWASSKKVKLTTVPIDGISRDPDEQTHFGERWHAAMHKPLVHPPARLKPAPGVQPGPIPDHADLGLDPDLCSGALRGGEQAAHHALTGFLARRAESYGDEAPDPGGDHGSRISPYLTWGNLSLRQAAQATSTRLNETRTLPPSRRGSWEASLATFEARLQRRSESMQELVWHPQTDTVNLDHAFDGVRPARSDRAQLDAWKAGLTGYPMVDAAMRALRETGRLSYRMRALLISFAAHDLWLDWREPGLHLARLSLDYEPGIHWRHVQIHAGTSGQTIIQIYNPTKQGLEHDPDGAFVRKWVPELERVPTSFIHTPWLLPEGMQQSLGCVIGLHYPAPIVDHAVAAREAQRRLHEAHERPVNLEQPVDSAEPAPRRSVPRSSRARRSQREKPTQLSFPID